MVDISRWDGSIAQQTRNGWGESRKNSHSPVQIVQTKLEVDDPWGTKTINDIKFELSSKFAQELFKLNVVEIVKQAPDLKYMEKSYVYLAKLRVVDPGISNIIVNKKCYIMNDEEFTEDEIQNAIKKIYPERFI